MQARSVRAGSIVTTFVEAGPRNAETVVLVHDGAPGTSAELCWEPIIADLARDYRVIAPDMLGFGGTDKVAFFDRSPYAARIEHLSEFFRAIELAPSAFVGASLGGSVILRALAQHPGALPITKAMSLSGPGGPFRRADAFGLLGAYVPSLSSTREVMELMVDSTAGLDNHILKRYENALAPGHWEAQNAGTLQNPSKEAQGTPVSDTYMDDLKSVKVPVQLVEGRNDKMIESGWAEAIAGRMPAAVATVGDFSHEPNIDRPDLLLPIIRTFLAS